LATIERREQTPGKVVYRVRWWANESQRSKTFKVYDEARRFKAVLEGDVANGTYVDPKSGQQTVKAFAEAWFPTVLNLRPTSKAQLHGSVFYNVVPEFGNLPLSGVTHAHVQLWVAGQVERLSASTIRKNVFALRRIMQAAVRQGLIRSNPADNISVPSPKCAEQRFLTQDEVIKLASVIKPRYRVMVLVAAFGGLRFGELCALRRANVDPMRCTVSVKETLIDVNNRITFGPPKTKASVRTVTLPRSVMTELVAHMSTYVPGEPDALLFTFNNGKPIRRAWFRTRTWLPALKSAGLEGLRFHDLRHTFVSLWVSLGRNPKEVSKVAGHSSVAFTLDRYGHLYDVHDDTLSDRLDLMLGA
jgi:integrase